MALTLDDLTVQETPASPAIKYYSGSATFITTESTKFVIKNHNDKIIEVYAPEGKSWNVLVSFSITETDS